MKKLILSTVLLFTLSSFSQTTFEWAKSIGGGNYDDARSIFVDSQGNSYVTGRVQKFVPAPIDFDPGSGVFNIDPAGQYDAYIVKLNTVGEFQWAKNFGGSGSQNTGSSIAVDDAGNVYTTGTFSYTVDFDPSATASFNLTAGNQFGNNATDIFISKLDSNGNFVWAKNIGSQFFEEGLAICCKNNTIYVTGKFAGSVNFDTNGGSAILTGVSSSSGFILKMGSDGSFGWAKSISGSGDEIIYAVDVDNAGNVYATGNFTSSTDLDPGLPVVNLAGFGNYILKLDISGNYIFAKGFTAIDTPSNLICLAVKVDTAGSIYSTGTFRQTVDFDPSSSVSNLVGTASTGTDVFLTKLDNNGNFVWAKHIYSNSTDSSRTLACDNLNNVYIAPNFQTNTYKIDGGATQTASNINSDIAAFFKFNSNGTLLARNFFDSGNTITTSCLGIDSSYKVYTCGVYSSPTDFNPDAATFNLSSNGFTDFYISKIGLRNETLSLNQNFSNNRFSAYPNPTSNHINFRFENNIDNANLKVISITGQTILEKQNLSGTDFNFDVSNLSAGIYIVKLANGNEIFNSKFIKK